MAVGSILFVAPSAYTLSGLATWLDYLMPGLAEIGWKVTLGLVTGPRHHRAGPYLAAHPYEDVVLISNSCSTTRGRVNAVRKAIKKVRPDIVLTVNIPDAIKATGLERMNGRDVRAVMSCHGIQEDLFNDMLALRVDLDAVVCTNQLACELSKALGGLAEEQVFHCACGTYVPPALASRSRKSPFTIGYCGRLEQFQKRIHDLVPIALALKNQGREFSMLIAGTGHEEASLRAAIQHDSLESCFKFLGCLDPQVLAKRLYEASDALLVTSSWETGPLVIWESMGLGTPVVSSRYVGSGREALLHHGENCLMFEVGDTSGAATELGMLQDSNELWGRIRKNGYETAKSKLTSEISVRNWDAILGGVLSKSLRRVPVVPCPSPSGRLNRVLGPQLAQFVRTLLNRRPPDGGPGGEWPHTMVGSKLSDDAFLHVAGGLDRTERSKAYHSPEPCQP